MSRTPRIALLVVLLSTALVIPAWAKPEMQEVIVVLEPGGGPVAQTANDIAAAHSGSVGFVYTEAIQGFTLTLPANAVAGLSQNPKIKYIEPVQEVAVTGTQPIPTGIDRVDADLNPPSTPMDVDIAILDTGVYIGTNPDGSARSHLDLNLRYVSDCTGAILYPLFGGCTGGGDPQDRFGHGTHVAGIAAALDNDIGSIGTAPGATLWSFKVLRDDGTGTTGMILAGIDAVAANADRIEVANMSFGFEGTSQALDDAIANATDRGVVFVAAAGNNAIDASGFSPGNGPDVITVSAIADFDGQPGGLGSPTCRTDVDDTLADFSNFGPAVEIATPGVCIFSTYLDDGYATFSGTSMAAPFMTGAVARYIAQEGLDPASRADVEAIKAAVIGAATPQASACGFTDVDSSPEPLLFLNSALFGGDGTCGGASTPPPNQAPQVDFGWSCTDLDCTFDGIATDPENDLLTYAWDFGDGGSSVVEDPSHSYATGGDYTVTLTVDDGTNQVTATHTVTATDPTVPNQAPQVDFGWSCTDLDCTFDATASDPENDPLTFAWDFGDGGSSATQNPSHSYATGGDYTVTLTVNDGTNQVTATHTVTATDPPVSTPEATAVVAPILVSGRDAMVTVTIIDVDLNGISGATVNGEWTYHDRRGRVRTSNDSGVTDGDGNVTFTRRLPRGGGVDSFCLTSVVAPGYDFVMPLYPLSCAFPLG